jgi:hypothetical protein
MAAMAIVFEPGCRTASLHALPNCQVTTLVKPIWKNNRTGSLQENPFAGRA